MLCLFETPAGFALFKVLKEKQLKDLPSLWQEFTTAEKAAEIVKLKAFSKFSDTTEALTAAANLVDSKVPKQLKKFLKKNCGEDKLAVVDAKLGKAINKSLGLEITSGAEIIELTRGIRSQMEGLLATLDQQNLTKMSLGLSHSLSRYKLKFSPDKIDTMVVQAIGLLDELDKELNTYAMRVREWYGWHFPEMTKLIDSNITYASVVKFMGSRDKALDLDFSAILDESVEGQLKAAAVVSMGTEMSEDDLLHVGCLCDQVIELSEYRTQLYSYLKNRMQAIAPNLTLLVGELVGARLIAHAGTLMNLAKAPASTVQILGAEKALFRALKTKHATPKYGLLFHASLIGQASPKNKGKIARVLAAKCALAIRVDALGEETDAHVGAEARTKVEARLRQLEGKELASDAIMRTSAGPEKYDSGKTDGALITVTHGTYNPDADVAMDVDEEPKQTDEPGVKEKSKKKKKKRSSDVNEESVPGESAPEEKPKKKKKRSSEVAPEDGAPGGESVQEEKPKKKKKRVQEAM